MNIPAGRLDRGFYKYQNEYEESALRVLRSGWYIMGKELEEFEESFAKYIGGKYCVGLGNGLDALWIAVRVLGIGEGDEVLVQGNTYIATVMGVTMNGATPVFIEPDENFGMNPDLIEANITERTKAILVTHLYGIATNMDKIVALAKKYNLKLIEDCAQSHGASYNGQMTGTFGDVGCFSFYPSKNVGAFGDGGAVVVNDKKLYDDFRVFRNYGSEKRYYNMVVGTNSRLDEIQAAMLKVKLSHIDELTAERDELARFYNENIKNDRIKLPSMSDGATCVWHQYVVRCEDRDELMEYLKEKGIGTIIHYPIPPHLAKAYEYLGHKKGSFPVTEHLADTVLSLPMYNGLTMEEAQYVVDALNAF